MQLEQFDETIHACRFCFMCRHLSPVGNVSFRESDTPRGRALLLDQIRREPRRLSEPDYLDAVYRSELSAACRFHCVSHYDEAGLIFAARADAVEAGLAPEAVRALAKELQAGEFKVEGQGEAIFFSGLYGEKQPEIAAAFARLAGPVRILRGGDCGQGLRALGFVREAVAQAQKLAATIKAAGAKTLIVADPASYFALRGDYAPAGIEVRLSAEYLLSRGLKRKSAGAAYYLVSDYLRNYCDNPTAPRELLSALGYELRPFGTNGEESYGVGEGSVVFDRLQPELTAKLCSRVRELADDPQHDLLITASPYVRFALRKYEPTLKVISIEEAAAQV